MKELPLKHHLLNLASELFGKDKDIEQMIIEARQSLSTDPKTPNNFWKIFKLDKLATTKLILADEVAIEAFGKPKFGGLLAPKFDSE